MPDFFVSRNDVKCYENDANHYENSDLSRREKTKASYCNDVQSNIDIQRGMKINSQYGHTIIFHVVVVFLYNNWKIEKTK